MKIAVDAHPLPDGALLETYRDMPGAHTDCYSASVDRPVSAAEFIEAFYTTGLFKCERLVLLTINRSCSDATVRALAAGERRTFAAWTVEGRTENQLLVRDYAGHTRSWLMVAAKAGEPDGTRLYFGSAVTPRSKGKDGSPRPGAGFRLLLPVHGIYARALLGAAARKLCKGSGR